MLSKGGKVSWFGPGLRRGLHLYSHPLGDILQKRQLGAVPLHSTRPHLFAIVKGRKYLYSV